MDTETVALKEQGLTVLARHLMLRASLGGLHLQPSPGALASRGPRSMRKRQNGGTMRTYWRRSGRTPVLFRGCSSRGGQLLRVAAEHLLDALPHAHQQHLRPGPLEVGRLPHADYGLALR